MNQSGIAGVVNGDFDPIRKDLNPIWEFLTEVFHQGLEYHTICGNKFAISAYHDSIGPFSVRKHPCVSSLITGTFNIRMPQPRYCFIWDVEKVLGFLNSLDSETIELKILIHKLAMLVALTRSSRAHGICYLEIRYLIKHISRYIFNFNKLTRTTRKYNIIPPIKYLNFNYNKNLCVCYHINLYLEKIWKNWNGEK